MRDGRTLEPPRRCDVCAGPVDIMRTNKALPDGRTVPTRIGACQRCGKWFNEAGLNELPTLPPSADSDTT